MELTGILGTTTNIVRSNGLTIENIPHKAAIILSTTTIIRETTGASGRLFTVTRQAAQRVAKRAARRAARRAGAA